MSRSHGFTLIELLIVVAIIAILAAIAVPNFLESQTRAKVSRAKADIRSLVTATESYHIDNGQYLTGQLSTDFTADKITQDGAPGETNPLMPRSIRLLTTPISYMSSIPSVAPFGGFRSYSANIETGYRYIGGKHLLGLLSPRLNYIPQYWPRSFRSTKYMWFAVGPSKVYSVKFRDERSVTPYQCPYDPTNGTVSIGDILYVNGNADGWHSFK